MDHSMVFRGDWRERLDERIAEAVEILSGVEGVRGLVLAGSNGRGEAWPLSDVDLLSIIDDARPAELRSELEALILETERRWVRQGFAMGLDAGKLTFSRSEVLHAVDCSGSAALDLLGDERWYHSLDKGYRGQPVYDPDSLARVLVERINGKRFDPMVVEFRQDVQRRRAVLALDELRAALDCGNLLGGTRALAATVGAVQTWWIEAWHERQSFARSATRFERAARQHGRPDLADRFHALTHTADAAIVRRIRVAPEPIQRWHAESFRARQTIGEEVIEIQDARDTLGVARHYEFRKVCGPRYPEWLAVVSDLGTLERKMEELSLLIDKVMVIKQW